MTLIFAITTFFKLLDVKLLIYQYIFIVAHRSQKEDWDKGRWQKSRVTYREPPTVSSTIMVDAHHTFLTTNKYRNISLKA